MPTIAHGTVNYRGIELLPCPDVPAALGECTRPGMLELWSNGRITETFALAAGDQLLVADGATVAAGTELTQRAPWQRALRADLPPEVEAIATWSEPPLSTGAPDASVQLAAAASGDTARLATGASDETARLATAASDENARFAPGARPVQLVLRDRAGHTLATYDVDRAARPVVTSGATVRRGDCLAWIPESCRTDRIAGIAALVAFLEARALGGDRAVIAPYDGTIEALDASTAALRIPDGRVLHLRLPRGRHLHVRVGDQLLAGDVISAGERSHHALLHAWGEARLAAHMVDELELESARRGLAVPRSYWALAVRAMLNWRRIRDPGDTALRTGATISRADLDHAAREALALGHRPPTAVPILRGLAPHRPHAPHAPASQPR